MLSIPRRAALTLAAVLCLIAPATATAAVPVGISDQGAATFGDPLFTDLHLRYARLITPWNSVWTDPAGLDTWLQAARAAGTQPLVAFNHSAGDQCPDQPCAAPSVGDFAAAFQEFHARYPWVTDITPWNEANHKTQPTYRDPERAAAFYDAVVAACPSCTVPGADLLDDGNLRAWVARFRNAVHGNPQLWGLHNYSDINRFRTSGTDMLLDAVPGQVWLTEAGGMTAFTGPDGRVAFPYDEARAARATSYMFRLAESRPRIARIYVYHWRVRLGDRFDAALVRPDGSPRPSYDVVKAYTTAGRLPDGGTVPKDYVPGSPVKVVGAIFLGRSRKVSVRVSCQRGIRGGCRGVLRLLAPGGRASAARAKSRSRARTTVVARTTFHIKAGATRAVRLRLSRASYARLRRQRIRKLGVQVITRTAGGKPADVLALVAVKGRYRAG